MQEIFYEDVFANYLDLISYIDQRPMYEDHFAQKSGFWLVPGCFAAASGFRLSLEVIYEMTSHPDH